MITQDDLYHKLLILVPGAKFSFWLDDNRELDWVDNDVTYVKLDGWCIAWRNDNAQICPTLDAINAVTAQQVTDYIAKEKISCQESQCCNDPIYKYCYNQWLVNNAGKTFCDFLTYINSL